MFERELAKRKEDTAKPYWHLEETLEPEEPDPEDPGGELPTGDCNDPGTVEAAIADEPWKSRIKAAHEELLRSVEDALTNGDDDAPNPSKVACPPGKRLQASRYIAKRCLPIGRGHYSLTVVAYLVFRCV